MKIRFFNVIPNPLSDEDLTTSEAWDANLVLEGNSPYFLSSNSGKGKSTFLNYIFGLRNDYQGKIEINDKETRSFTLDDWAKLRKDNIAYLPQDLQLIPHLTVWENLCLKNQLTNHCSEKEIKDFLEKYNLLDKLNKPVQQLSIGQQQRVALIRTILQPFELLLLDEPFSHLDEENIAIGFEIIDKVCQQQNAFYIIATLGYNYGVTANKTLLL